MKVEAIGMIQEIGQVQEFGQNGFQKVEVILKTIEQNPQFYKLEFAGQNVALTESLQEGSNFKVTCNLNGREYTSPEGNYSVFMSLNAWKVERI